MQQMYNMQMTFSRQNILADLIRVKNINLNPLDLFEQYDLETNILQQIYKKGAIIPIFNGRWQGNKDY